MDETAPQLTAFVELLVKWNRAYNLTAERDPAHIAVRHVRDSLAVLPYLHGATVLDVGTGAGLPGLVLAIADPLRHYTLLDSNGKKTRFCEHAVGALGVANVVVEQARIESYRPGVSFDTVVTRAFATIADFIEAAGRHCAPGGRMLAMKGAYPEAELAALPDGWRADAVHALHVPGLDARRHLAILTRH